MLFSLPKRKVDDPVFGLLTLVDDETCYYGTYYFAPLKIKITINVFSRLYAPTDWQRSLFKEIEKNYFACVEKLPTIIEEEFRKERKGFLIRNFSKEFELSGITIREFEDTQVKFELDYDTIHELDGWVNIRFIDWEPIEVSFEQ